MITKDEILKSKDKLHDAGFTRCQIDVLGCLVEGKSNREIGNILFVTEKAVKYHMTNLIKKFEVKGREDVVAGVARLVRGK